MGQPSVIEEIFDSRALKSGGCQAALGAVPHGVLAEGGDAMLRRTSEDPMTGKDFLLICI